MGQPGYGLRGLAEAIQTPGPQSTVSFDTRGVVRPARNGLPVLTNSDELRRVLEGPVAQFAVEVVPPPPQAAIGLDRQGVAPARTHEGPCRIRPNSYRLAGTIERLLAQLAGVVVAPAPQAAIGFERQGVVTATGD